VLDSISGYRASTLGAASQRYGRVDVDLRWVRAQPHSVGIFIKEKTMDDTEGKMFLVKEFQAHYRPMGPANDPSAPSLHMVTLQFLSEVGGPTTVMGSPLMFLSPKIARELGQRLLREAKLAAEADRETTNRKPRH
jgi:hypothetical protein